MRRGDGIRSGPSTRCIVLGTSRADGTATVDSYQPPTGDMFHVWARRSAVPAMLRGPAGVVESVGRFDPSYRRSADWDLWQRIARTGARFRHDDSAMATTGWCRASVSLDAELFWPTIAHHPARERPRSAGGQSVTRTLIRSRERGLSAGAFICSAGAPASCWGRIATPAPRCRSSTVIDSRAPSPAVAETLIAAEALPACLSPAQWAAAWPAWPTQLRGSRPAGGHSGARDLATAVQRSITELVLLRHPLWAEGVAPLRRELDESRLANDALEESFRLGVASYEARLRDFESRAAAYEARLRDFESRATRMKQGCACTSGMRRVRGTPARGGAKAKDYEGKDVDTNLAGRSSTPPRRLRNRGRAATRTARGLESRLMRNRESPHRGDPGRRVGMGLLAATRSPALDRFGCARRWRSPWASAGGLPARSASFGLRSTGSRRRGRE